jgi:hypothetical protein
VNRAASAHAAALAVLLLGSPAGAQPKAEVHERAFDETDSGLFLRGGSSVWIEVAERCEPACRQDQECDMVCREAACEPGVDPLARCNQCRWTCVP